MKKKCIYALAGLMALGACSKDEVVDVKTSGSIDFRPLTEISTRGTTTTLTNLSPFTVRPLKVDNSRYAADMTVSSTDEGATWTTNPLTYWPTSATEVLHFYAYAPTTTTGVTIDNTGKKITDFTPAATVANQKDLVIAYNTGTKQANETSGVPLVFKHALAQIVVKAKCPSTTMQVEVLGVKLANVVKKGTFTWPAAPTALSTNEATNNHRLTLANWGFPTPSADTDSTSYLTKVGTTPITLNSTVQDIQPANGAFLIVPQAVHAWNKKNKDATEGSYLAVLCRYKNKVGENNYVQIFPGTADKYGFACVAVGTTEKDKEWLPGKKYIYTLEFFGTDSGGGKKDPDPTDPENPNPGGGGGDIDPGDGGEHGGEDIVKPIKFTVSVEDFEEVEVTELNM